MSIRNYLVFVLYSIAINAHEVKSNQSGCPPEHIWTGISTIPSDPRNTEITWISDRNQVTDSSPQCLNDKEELLLRICNNGTWWPLSAPQCKAVKHDSKTCPVNSILLHNQCVHISLPQPMNTSCPLGFSKYYNSSGIGPELSMWTSIRKRNHYYIYTEPGSRFGKQFIITRQKFDCYVRRNQTLFPVYCNASHHQMCLQMREANSANRSVQVELKFDHKGGKLVLIVYQPQNILLQYGGQEEAIYCFTNGDALEVKMRLKVQRIVSKEAMNVYEFALRNEYPGEYWCEVFDLQENIVKTNTLLANKRKQGHEYSLRTRIPLDEVQNDIYKEAGIIRGSTIMKLLEKIDLRRFFHTDLVIRLMEIVDADKFSVEIILHLTTLRQTNIIGEYYRIQGILVRISKLEIINFRSSEICFPEKTNTSEGYILEWKSTELGKKVLPDSICLNERQLPHKRACLGNFVEGAFWGEYPNTCEGNAQLSPFTQKLYNLSRSAYISTDALTKVQEITSHMTDMLPLDVYLTATVLHNFVNDPREKTDKSGTDLTSVSEMIKAIENIMHVNNMALKEAQIELNATDSILDVIEKIFGEETSIFKGMIMSKINSGEVFIMVTSNLIVHITKPFLSNVNGIAYYCNDKHGASRNTSEMFREDCLTSMALDEKFEDLINHFDLEFATYVPLPLLETIAAKIGSKDNVTIVTSVFLNARLFNSANNESGVPRNRVISVKMPDFEVYLDEPLPLLFRTYTEDRNHTCAYWLYGEHSPDQMGQWSTMGGQVDHEASQKFNFEFVACYFHHLTHFALLILNRPPVIIESEPDVTNKDTTLVPASELNKYSQHQVILSIITIVGCVLSLIGILGIFLTAICFRKWRQKTGSKILLQLCLTIMLEMVVMHVAGADTLSNNRLLCDFVGMCLQYVVLSKSSWMFISAILQYLRFVKIFQAMPSRLIPKAMLFAWGIPTIPVGLVAVLIPNVYSLGSQHFCYPIGYGLYFGLFAPVVLIVMSNLIVFIMIMKSVANPSLEVKLRSNYSATNYNRNIQNKLQVYLGILLFFMLGMPWVFGILAEIVPTTTQLIFVYLFCLTATLQGGVLFLFYIILDRDTRLLWIKFYRRLPECKSL